MYDTITKKTQYLFDIDTISIFMYLLNDFISYTYTCTYEHFICYHIYLTQNSCILKDIFFSLHVQCNIFYGFFLHHQSLHGNKHDCQL